MKVLTQGKLRGQKYYPYQASGSGAIISSLWLELPYLEQLFMFKNVFELKKFYCKGMWSAQSFCQKPLQNVLKNEFVYQFKDQVQSEVAHASMDNTLT